MGVHTWLVVVLVGSSCDVCLYGQRWEFFFSTLKVDDNSIALTDVEEGGEEHAQSLSIHKCPYRPHLVFLRFTGM